MTPQPPNPELAALRDLFLLNPKNRAFVEGHSGRIATNSTRHIFTAILIVAMAVILASVSQSIAEWNIFIQQEQATTQGNVVSKETDSSCHENGCSYWYRVAYSFSVAARVETVYTAVSDVDQSSYDRLTEGVPVEITYLPINPNISWITGYDRYSDPTTLGILINLACGNATIFVVISTFRFTQRTRRLAREGRLIRGEVTQWDLQKRSDSEGGTYIVCVISFKIRAPDGREINPCKTLSNTSHRPRETGAPVAVLYVNDNLYEVL